MKVFISYCGKNGRILAEKLANILGEEKNSDVWYYSDIKYITGELSWIEIYEEIMKKDWMLVLTTENTHLNMNQRNEYINAIYNGKRTIAFAQRGVTVPLDLKSRNIGYFDIKNFKDACIRLIQDMKKVEKAGENISVSYDIITKLRANVEGLNIDRIKEYRKLIIDRYLSITEIRKILNVSIIPDDRDAGLGGQYIWWEDDLKQFQREDIHYGVICQQIADAIAQGEKTYLVKELNRYSAKRYEIDDMNNQKHRKIFDQISLLSGSGFAPNLFLLPVSKEVDLIKNLYAIKEINNVNWRIDGKPELHLKDGSSITVCTHIIPELSDEIIIGNGKYLRWSIKPDSEDGALATAIGKSPLYKDKVDFFANTVYKLEILKPEAFTVITLH